MMNRNELISIIKNTDIDKSCITETKVIPTDLVCNLLEHLDEPIIGDVYVILERLRQLAIRDREDWLRIIMKEFGECISDSEYNRGYTKGKLDYAFKDSKTNIPDFIANWIIRSRDIYSLTQAMTCGSIEVSDWLSDEDNQRKFAMAWFYGYKMDEKKDKMYLVKMKSIEDHNSYLKYNKNQKIWYFGSKHIYVNDVDTRTYHTLKELENSGLSEVFNNPLFEVTEVE